MKPTNLTTHKLKKLKKGDVVLYKGDVCTVEKIGNKYVYLHTEEGKERKASMDEIAAYTRGIADATKAFAACMREHTAEVRSGRYTSRYFTNPPPKAY